MSTNTEVEAFLQHYGVKGMKWGVTRSKPTTGQILDARARVGSQQRSIQRQVDKTNLARPGRQQAAEAKKLNTMTMDFLKNPDRVTALKMTKGEKYAMAFIAVGIPGIGTGAAAGHIGGRAVAKGLVRRQQTKLGVKRYG